MSRKPPAMILFPTQTEEESPSLHRKPRRRRAPKGQSILERFDKLANARLDERGDDESSSDDKSTRLPPRSQTYRPKKSISKNMSGSVKSFDVEESVGLQHDNELAEAVDKLIKAEETSRFTKMVVAAEAAVAAAPPELAEEAALAVAHEFQTRHVSVVHEEIPGDTIIEIVGYVGIRRRARDSEKYCVC